MTELSLARLGGKDAKGQNFFLPHHLAAAERLERLATRAQLSTRMTMSYRPRINSGSAINLAGELSDSAADARNRLQALATALPMDCWGVALDFCLFGKGLQDIETERQWPRRSAKLVLRIALDQLAIQFGLAPYQAGTQGGRLAGWLSEKLPLIAEPRP